MVLLDDLIIIMFLNPILDGQLAVQSVDIVLPVRPGEITWDSYKRTLYLISVRNLSQWRHYIGDIINFFFFIKAFTLFLITLEALIFSEWLTPR